MQRTQRTFVDPLAVEWMMRNHTGISTDAVARQLKATRTQVEAALFRIRSQRGERGSRNIMSQAEFDTVAERFPARRRRASRQPVTQQQSRTVGQERTVRQAPTQQL